MLVVSTKDRLEVVVGVIFNATRDRVLISRRRNDVDQGGLWEFPGGKCEDGEDKDYALKRELHEELGIQVGKCEMLLDFDYEYPTKNIHFSVSTIYEWDGEPYAKEGQIIDWVAIGNLEQREFPEANIRIIAGIRAISNSGE